jgi:hypothetical protein
LHYSEEFKMILGSHRVKECCKAPSREILAIDFGR